MITNRNKQKFFFITITKTNYNIVIECSSTFLTNITTICVLYAPTLLYILLSIPD